MDQDSVYNQEELEDITPYENYVSAIRDSETKRHYQGQLEIFLNLNYEWNHVHAKLVEDLSIQYAQTQ